MGAMSVALLSVALTGALLLYITLVSSPAREGIEIEKNDARALAAYQFWAVSLAVA